MIHSETILFPVANVKIGPDRRNVNEETVKEIAHSIAQRGLIHTILIEEGTNTLIAGAHRLAAFKLNAAAHNKCEHPEYNDWTTIPARFAFNVTESELVALELEENLRRHELPWEDAARGVRKYHTIHQEMNEEWTLQNTADALGMSRAYACRYIQVAKELEAGNTQVSGASSLRTAAEIITRGQERAVHKELQNLEEVDGKPQVETGESIFNADFIEWVKTYSGPKFNFIHCDFPYGINFHKSAAGHTAEWEGYKDTKDIYFTLLNTLLKERDRILYPSAHIFFWFSMTYYAETIAAFNACPDLTCNPFPCIWHKTNKGIVPDPQRGFRRSYETALLISRGDRKVLKVTDNVYAAPVSKSIHVSEKPESVLRHFFSALVDEHTELLDPTCGSGSALRAAESLQAPRVMGLEIDKDICSLALGELERARRLRAIAK